MLMEAEIEMILWNWRRNREERRSGGRAWQGHAKQADSRACIPSSWGNLLSNVGIQVTLTICRNLPYISPLCGCNESSIEVLRKPGLILWDRSTNSSWLQPLLLSGFLLPRLSLLVSTAQPCTSKIGFPSPTDGHLHWGGAKAAPIFYVLCFWLLFWICHEVPRGQNIWIKRRPLPVPRSTVRNLILKNALEMRVLAAAGAILAAAGCSAG